MATMLVSIDKAGRVVIPKEMRESLDITPDSQLRIDVEGHSIRIEPVRPSGRVLSWSDDGRPYFAAVEGHVITDLDVQRLRDADQR